MTAPRTLPEGGRLLHIGFRKCGTTAIQGALQRARPELAACGVSYPGSMSSHTHAALAITGRTRGRVTLGAKPQPMRKWDELVAEVAELGRRERAVVSSEFFDVADEPTIHAIAAGLGGDRMEVVVTVRPLSKILPSAWQQQVQAGVQRGYGDWLKSVLEGSDRNKTHKTFWERHDHAEVLSRWAGVLGPERVTLIVLDERDRMLPYRSFETMLGAPEGTLREEVSRTNRSMTTAEVELIRQINKAIFASDVTWSEYNRWIYRGAADRVLSARTPGPEEPRTVTPQWALERATLISAGFVERIAGLGITVIGDLERLATPPPAGESEPVQGEPTSVPIEVAAQAVLGAAFSTRKRAASPVTPPTSVGELSTRELSSRLVRRARRRLGRVAGSGRYGD